MSISAALKTWLEKDPDVAAAVGGRVFPDRLPQGADFPQVTYEQHAESTLMHLGGLSGSANPTYAVRCWGRTKPEAKGLADHVRGNKSTPKLDGFRGLIQCSDGGKVRVQCARLVDASDEYLPTPHGDDAGLYCTTQLYRLFYEDV